MAPPRLWLSPFLIVIFIAGCPRRFDPRADEIHSQNPAAEAEYRAAQRQYQAGEYAAASASVQKFGEHFGEADPLSPWVRLLDARIAAAAGQLSRARELLAPLADSPDSKLATAARYELGRVAHRLGDAALALQLLPPFSGQIVDGDEATELHAVLADAYLRAGRTREALAEYALFFPRARPIEQAYVQSQVRALWPRLSPADQADAQSRFALGQSEAASSSASPGAASPGLRLGLVLPLTGKDRALGERVLRGALWAARGSYLPAGGQPAQLPVEILTRDSASSATGATAAVQDLLRAGVQALVASPVKAEGAAVAKAAAESRVPILQLAAPTTAGTGTSSVFHLLFSNEERAQRLAAQLRSSGLTSVAVLAPATPYGQSMTRAFVEALASSSVQVLGQLSFPANATTFTAPAKQLIELGPQALFIPATAAQLELIAGQLAALSGLATQRVEKRESEPPIRLLLSTVEGLGPRLIKTSGRYLQGAVLAPVATAGLTLLPPETRFDGYAQDGGAEPGALDAIGFDAIETLRLACVGAASASGPCLAAGLQTQLALISTPGTTGDIAFSPAGGRRGQPLLLRLEGQALRVLR